MDSGASKHAPFRRVRIYAVPAEEWESAVGLGAVQDAPKLLQLTESSLEKLMDETLRIGKESITVPPESTSTETRGLSCITCGITFPNLNAQRQHFKLDWHRYNIKMKLKNSPMISEEQFENLSDISSISASDSENEGSRSNSDDEDDEFVAENALEKTEGSPFVSYRNKKGHVIQLYRVFVEGKKRGFESQQNPIEEWTEFAIHASKNVRNSPYIKSLPFQPYKSLIILCGGGHFAGAIFNRDAVLCHKTFHRYTTRRKAGGSQSAHDNKSGKAKSAGANLRRYNEQALQTDIQQWLHSVSKDITDCQYIFIHAPSMVKSAIYSSPETKIGKDDARVRSIPFTTRRATFSEAQRVYEKLSTVCIFDKTDEHDENFAVSGLIPTKEQISSIQDTDNSRRNVKVPNPDPDDNHDEDDDDDEEEEDDILAALKDLANVKVDDSNYPLHAACCGQNKDKVREAISANPASINTRDNFCYLPLHYASSRGSPAIVELLLSHEADPTLLDLRSRPPYYLSQSKATRDAFRRFMANNPDKWDWNAAKIPSALSEDAESKRKDALRRKKREQRKRASQRKKEEREREQEIEREKEKERQREKQAKEELASMPKPTSAKPSARGSLVPKLAPTKQPELPRGGQSTGSQSTSASDSRLQTKPTTSSDNLSAQERRELHARAAEARLAKAALPPNRVCHMCQKGYNNSQGFTYMDFGFCSTVCLQQHKRQNPS